MAHNRKTCPECQFETNMDEVSVIGENHAQPCSKRKPFPEQKEEWGENGFPENNLIELAKEIEESRGFIFYKQGLGRFDDELRRVVALAEERGREEAITYIADHQGWEESEDIYRKHFGFPPKYANRTPA